MRAAEYLVSCLLDEATPPPGLATPPPGLATPPPARPAPKGSAAIVLGPGLSEPTYVNGTTFKNLMGNLAKAIGGAHYALSRSPANLLTSYISRDFAILVRDGRDFIFFGKKEVKYPERARRVIGLLPTDAVSWVREIGTSTSHKLSGANFE